MKNVENWKPSSYIMEGDHLRINEKFFLANNSSISMNEFLPEIEYCIKKYCKGFLLDLGCGQVPFYELYRKLISNNICADWENSCYKHEFVDVFLDLNKKWVFNSNSFDTVLCTSVLEHLYDPFLFFSESKRILKENGCLIFSTVFSYWEHEAPNDYLRHSRFFIKKIAKEYNFSIKELRILGDGLSVLADLVQKIYNNEKDFINENKEFKELVKICHELYKKNHKKRLVLPAYNKGAIVVFQKNTL